MRRLITLSLLALLIGLTGYQASASTERTSSATVSGIGDQLGASAYPTGTWNSGIQVQNPTTSSATVQVKFYDINGLLVFTTTPPTTIVAGGSATYYLPDAAFASLPNGKYSGVVESDQAVVAVVNETNDISTGLKGLADSYNGIASGGLTSTMPLVFRARNNVDSMVAVQNTDSSTTANVTLNFYTTGQSAVKYSKTDTIPALATHTYDLSSDAFSTLGSGWVGSLVVTSNTNVAAVAHSVRSTATGELSIYRGFSAGSTKYFAPLVFNEWTGGTSNDAISGIQVQNLGSTADTVTMIYSVAGGGSGTYTCSGPLSGSSSLTFYMPNLPDTGAGITCNSAVPVGNYGSVVIQAGSNQVAVVVNNNSAGRATASAYNAFVDGAGSTRVVVPLVYIDRGGYSTGIQVQNVGTAADTLTMVFRPTNQSAVPGAAASYTVPCTIAGGSTSVPAGQACTFGPGYSSIPSGLYGTADITSTSQKIIAVINTTQYTNQTMMTYTGINP
ncbi:MAG: hypothetical protein Q8P59_07590 [Dehalococcoidia bacterium]|nr:hypothetical protein [Dehalococcoidia bacterium]